MIMSVKSSVLIAVIINHNGAAQLNSQAVLGAYDMKMEI